MPSVIVGGRPAPEPIGASFDSVSGSFSETATITPRFTTLSTSVNEPGTGLAAGHGTSFRSSLVTNVPTLRGCVATTACVRATSTSRTGRLFSASHTPYAAMAAMRMATASTISVRVFRFIRPLLTLTLHTHLRCRGQT